jgi:hypothetical protein
VASSPAACSINGIAVLGSGYADPVAVLPATDGLRVFVAHRRADTLCDVVLDCQKWRRLVCAKTESAPR